MEQQQQQQQFDLLSLPFSQLQSIKKNFEQEVEFLTNQYTALRMALQKFIESKDALESVAPDNEGKGVFIPMTASVRCREFLLATHPLFWANSCTFPASCPT